MSANVEFTKQYSVLMEAVQAKITDLEKKYTDKMKQYNVSGCTLFSM